MRDTDDGVEHSIVQLTDETLSTISVGKLDSFLKMDGIKGESTEKNHTDWIEILSWR